MESLRAYSTLPLLIAIEQEGGRVCRLKERYGFPPTVSSYYSVQNQKKGSGKTTPLILVRNDSRYIFMLFGVLFTTLLGLAPVVVFWIVKA